MDDETPASPFTRPAFLASAAIIALIIIAALILVVATRIDSHPAPTAAPVAPGTGSGPAPEEQGDDSVCGLRGSVAHAARLTAAPTVDQWDYQGTIAYPTSEDYGPGAVSPEGYRYCFQRSPEGALYMAANALAQGADPDAAAAWGTAAIADGPYRDELLSGSGTAGSDPAGTRLRIAGFRLLAYDGASARVDLAVRGSSANASITGSFVYDLVWQGGDWRISAETPTPLDFAVLPDLVGYVAWSS